MTVELRSTTICGACGSEMRLIRQNEKSNTWECPKCKVKIRDERLK